MYIVVAPGRRGHSFGWRLIGAMLCAALLAAACSGDDSADAPSALGGSAATRVGTGSVPYYEPSTGLLTLPQLKVDGTIQSGVKLHLASDGSWELASKGASRLATSADQPAATLTGATGASTDLESTRLDATLLIQRLHAGTRVFGGVAVKLTAGRWTFASAPRETKMLHAEDFRSSAAISANESHHVVLKSNPETGVQNIPMRLSTRSYRFCMDAQAEGADTMTLIGPAGGAVFTLKAGDACVTINAVEGPYTLEHRYGGKGASRTVFMRHEANTATATPSAPSQRATVLSALSPSAGLQASGPLSPQGDEYWAVRNPAVPLGDLHFSPYLGTGGGYRSPCDGPLSFGGLAFGSVADNTMLKVSKDPVSSTPTALGQSLASSSCANGGFKFVIGPDLLATNMQILDLHENQFQLPITGKAAGSTVAVVPSSLALVVGFRYFPAGLQQPVQLDVGQIAFYAGANCSGPAIATTDPLAGLNSIFLSGSNRSPRSTQVGLMTRAIFRDLSVVDPYGGAATAFNQLACTNFGPQYKPDAVQIAVDTVTVRISTDGCEYCNLAGGDFTGIDLANAKLRGANLSSAFISNRDLSGADLRFANLQGAFMTGSNLEGANLCSAQLNASPLVPVAATLSGAHLKNTNLALAILDGVDFSGASFYSSGQPASCQETSCGSYVAPSCAGAHGASIQSANFDSAYIANADMSGVHGRGVTFSNATLFGVSLAGANLAVNADAGTGSKFRNAKLQGTDFSNAILGYADFTGAQTDPASSCIQAMLPQGFLQFPGATVPASAGISKCVAGKQAAPFCVQASFAAAPRYPATDCTNICADGRPAGPVDARNGSCTVSSQCADATWGAALANGATAIATGSCQGAAPLCGDPFKSTLNTCW